MFRTPEMGRGEIVDDLDKVEGGDIEELITEVQQEILSSVDLTPENSSILNEIFDKARVTYDKDAKAWDLLFENLTTELSSTSDDDDAADTLDLYQRKATSLGKS
jgi:uncharacterized protein YegL